MCAYKSAHPAARDRHGSVERRVPGGRAPQRLVRRRTVPRAARGLGRRARLGVARGDRACREALPRTHGTARSSKCRLESTNFAQCRER